MIAKIRLLIVIAGAFLLQACVSGGNCVSDAPAGSQSCTCPPNAKDVRECVCRTCAADAAPVSGTQGATYLAPLPAGCRHYDRDYYVCDGRRYSYGSGFYRRPVDGKYSDNRGHKKQADHPQASKPRKKCGGSTIGGCVTAKVK